MRTLLLLLAAAFLVPAAHAQTVLFDFEGFGGSTEGWAPDVPPDTDLPEGDRSLVRAVDQKLIGFDGPTPLFIPPYEGSYLLEAVPNRPIPANAFRGMKYTWATGQDWTGTPVLKMAASMQARGANSERHEFRIRVISGTGADADTTEMMYIGLKSEGADDTIDNNSFVNDWEVLEFDLSGYSGVNAITSIEAAGRHVDDGSNNTPDSGMGTWGGLVQIDSVAVDVQNTSVEGEPGLAALSDVYPNPSASRAQVGIAVETAQRVTATVHDVLGRTVATAFDGPLAPGATALLGLDTSRLAPGTYVLQVRGETFTASRRLTVAR
jgi:hypothetical protein